MSTLQHPFRRVAERGGFEDGRGKSVGIRGWSGVGFVWRFLFGREWTRMDVNRHRLGFVWLWARGGLARALKVGQLPEGAVVGAGQGAFVAEEEGKVFVPVGLGAGKPGQ